MEAVVVEGLCFYLIRPRLVVNDSFCSSELLLYVVVSSLRQLAHGPHTSTAKNRAGSPHSVCMYYTTLYTSQLIARHVGKDFSSSEEITGQPREKAPAADVQLAFWEESYSRSVLLLLLWPPPS